MMRKSLLMISALLGTFATVSVHAEDFSQQQAQMQQDQAVVQQDQQAMENARMKTMQDREKLRMDHEKMRAEREHWRDEHRGQWQKHEGQWGNRGGQGGVQQPGGTQPAGGMYGHMHQGQPATGSTTPTSGAATPAK